MKKSIIITGLALMFGITTLSAQSTHRIDKRQQNQRTRIEAGVANGELTARETKRLVRQQAKVKHLENKANADGVVNLRERRRIEKAQDKANRTIARKKHNARDRN
ncbi:MAG: hypothetical protein KDD04_07405 [Sinomicrobium sp.]|nr:hypothetical protein [Sinomicrobium sp.]